MPGSSASGTRLGAAGAASGWAGRWLRLTRGKTAVGYPDL